MYRYIVILCIYIYIKELQNRRFYIQFFRFSKPMVLAFEHVFNQPNQLSMFPRGM